MRLATFKFDPGNIATDAVHGYGDYMAAYDVKRLRVVLRGSEPEFVAADVVHILCADAETTDTRLLEDGASARPNGSTAKTRRS